MTHTTLPLWRGQNAKSLNEIALLLGLSGRNPARTLQRYESGERPCPLAIAVAIERLTKGQVMAESFAGLRVARKKPVEVANAFASEGIAGVVHGGSR